MQVRKITAHESAALADLVASAPFSNHLVAAKLRREPNAEVWGCWDDGALQAAAAVGSTVYPTRVPASCAPLLAKSLASRASTVSSITGERDGVFRLWQELQPLWPGAARLIRERQPFLVLEAQLSRQPDSPVRLVREDELAPYTAAGAKMFAAEIEAPPPIRALQHRYRASIKAGHSFAAFDEGRVYFKCDIGFVLDDTAHLQGVWLAPELRGKGLSTSLLAAALANVQSEIAPKVSLYVNAFNQPALALYRRLGFEQVDEYATVFF